MGTDAAANTDAILARANQIKSLDPNVSILVIATDKPIGGVLNTMDYSQGYDTRHCGDIGECTYPRLGASHAHINSELPDSVGAAVHDIFHFAGIDEEYKEGPRDSKRNRTAELKPGYTAENIMSTRSGNELKADQLLQAKKNPTTKPCTSDDPRQPRCAR